ncbi:MAG: AAA family ATPase [Thermoanaerobacteraceae bacterium]|nr:AAA family ATPase [Thermoanaerobacteraceae bacterium]
MIILKKVYIENFRCLKNIEVKFENDITVIVGENDAGKTSLIDVLKIIFQGKKIEIDDFFYGTDTIKIKVEFDDETYLLLFKREGETINSKFFIYLTQEKLEQIKKSIYSDDFVESDDNITKAKNIASIISVSYRSNTPFNTLKKNLTDKINDLINNSIYEIETTIPNKNAYFLDGKDFEDITTFINELFFREERRNIWNERIEEDKTIGQAIEEHLKQYEKEVNNNINQEEIISRIKGFLPSLTEIAVTSDFILKDLNIDVSVKMLENGAVIPIDKKGDGTKRRITMALFDYKSDNNGDSNLYVLDEPDTHLHVKAQLELMKILNNFTNGNKQIIITTHSPFIINYCKPIKIRLFCNKNNETKVSHLNNCSDVEEILRDIGVENIFLFFAKKILIVEGETEEKFIPIIFDRLFNINLSSNLIKIMNVKGIKNVPGFSNALLQLINKDNIYALIDNDADDVTIELINRLDLANDHLYKIGQKEFEDSFKPKTIYNCWKKHVESRNRNIGNRWTEEEISRIKEDCLKNSKKFSKKLKELNDSCLIGLDKIKLGTALGNYCEIDELDDNLKKFLYILKD